MRKAEELLSHIKDRPCEACEYKVNGDCTVWACVFDEWLYKYVYGRQKSIKPDEERRADEH